jgi:hypothetical protein
MPLSHLYRFFIPMENPVGFGVADYILLAVALLLVGGFLLRSRIEVAFRSLAMRPRIGLAIIAALPVVLRLALLPTHPVPVPEVSDDFSYLLLGDALAHFRFANPAHPMHRFFEGVFTLQTPAYASNFPPGQGIALAFGQLLFHLPWVGVLLTIAIMCGLCYWMLRGWIPPTWALAGGILSAVEFGPLSSWMNTYWGGAVSAIAGCLVFGAIPRLRSGKTRYAVILGAGVGLQMISRPFESVLLIAAVLLFSIPRRSLAIATLTILPVAGLTLLQNKQTTGNWTTLPYVLSRYQYGIPTTFTFQPVPIPHNELTVEQKIDYESQSETHGRGTFPGRFIERLRFYRFFFLAPLYAALPFFLWSLRKLLYIRVLLTVAIFATGATFYPYFYPHYVAALTCLFVLISLEGLKTLNRISPDAARIILILCIAHFCFWYAIHLFGSRTAELATSSYEGWDTIDDNDPYGRAAINRQLAQRAGNQLVLVRYGPRHGPVEWIHNASDIDRSRVVWAIDLGPAEDKKLALYYPTRNVWILEADATPPRLTPVIIP